MWNLTNRNVTVNLVDGTTFSGRARFNLAWWTLVLDRAKVINGGRVLDVDGRVRIPARQILFIQVADRTREVTA